MTKWKSIEAPSAFPGLSDTWVMDDKGNSVCRMPLTMPDEVFQSNLELILAAPEMFSAIETLALLRLLADCPENEAERAKTIASILKEIDDIAKKVGALKQYESDIH